MKESLHTSANHVKKIDEVHGTLARALVPNRATMATHVTIVVDLVARAGFRTAAKDASGKSRTRLDVGVRRALASVVNRSDVGSVSVLGAHGRLIEPAIYDRAGNIVDIGKPVGHEAVTVELMSARKPSDVDVAEVLRDAHAQMCYMAQGAVWSGVLEALHSAPPAAKAHEVLVLAFAEDAFSDPERIQSLQRTAAWRVRAAVQRSNGASKVSVWVLAHDTTFKDIVRPTYCLNPRFGMHWSKVEAMEDHVDMTGTIDVHHVDVVCDGWETADWTS